MRKLAAIMFSDITGYSAMMSKDEKNAMMILEKNRGIHKSIISKFNGQYIKEIGDGTLAIFPSAYDAVGCAISIRNACSAIEGLRIRIGIHLGDVVIQDNDVFGDSVNIASRIESAGEPGGIFISGKVYDDLKNKEGIEVEFYGEKNLKNIPDPVKIYRITSQGTGLEFDAENHTNDNFLQKRKINKANKLLLSSAAILVITLIAFYLIRPGFLSKDQLKDMRSADGKISVAILPFYNMTNDSIWNVWQEGIQDMLINSLSNSAELKVRQFESVNSLLKSKGVVNYASLTPDLAGNLSQKLDAGVFIFGNIKKAGSSLRISAQLIDSKTQEVFKSFQIAGSASEDHIFPILDSLALMVKDFLIIRQMEKEMTPDYQRLVSTKSPEAYRAFIMGKNAFMKRDFRSAAELFKSALQIDTNFTLAGVFLSISSGNMGNYDNAKKYCLLIHNNKDRESYVMKVMINWCHAVFFETPNEELIYCKQLIDIDNQNPMFYYQLAYTYASLMQYDKAIPEYEKSLEIYKNWESKPYWIYQYTGLIEALVKTGQFEKAISICAQAEKDFPDEISVQMFYAESYLAIGDTQKANDYITKVKAYMKGNSRPEHRIELTLGNIFANAGLDDEAESHYRKAFELMPDDIGVLNTLGYFLANKERNVDEGVKLLTKALKMAPEDFYLMDSKGWALYKQGKTGEALALIEKSNSLSPVYNHEIYTHLQVVKNTVSTKI